MQELVYIIQAPPFWLKTPPLSLVYLKTYLQSKGISAGIIDINTAIFKSLKKTPQEWLKLDQGFEEGLFDLTEKYCPETLENLYQKIKDTPFIGFSLSKRNSPFVFALTKRIKNRFPDKKIVFGGPEVFSRQKSNQLDSEDYWVVGEGEIPLEQIVNGQQNRFFDYQEIPDLDKLSFYDFQGFNNPDYLKSIPLFSSRGCLNQCSFCSERRLYKNFRSHSPEYIIEQIKFLKNKYQVSNFVFLDSMINHNQGWLEKFCRGLIQQNFKINWEAQFRINNNFGFDLARLMKKSGCYNLFIGLESASNRVLKLMNKGFGNEEALNCFRTLYKANLHFEISLIFGYPGEKENDFRKTLQFISSNKRFIPKIAQVNPFCDYLGNFPDKQFPSAQGQRRVKAFLNLISEEKIPYTRSFINNLIYNKCR